MVVTKLDSCLWHHSEPQHVQHVHPEASAKQCPTPCFHDLTERFQAMVSQSPFAILGLQARLQTLCRADSAPVLPCCRTAAVVAVFVVAAVLVVVAAAVVLAVAAGAAAAAAAVVVVGRRRSS